MSARLQNKQGKSLTARTKAEDTDLKGEETDLMVRALIRQVMNTEDSQSAHPEMPGVLMDVTMAGVRCLLVRVEPQTQSERTTPAHAQVMLSPREEEIARMVAAGYPNKTIAAVLDISSWTVGTHLRRVFAKLGVGSRAAMVARLLEEGRLRYRDRHA